MNLASLPWGPTAAALGDVTAVSTDTRTLTPGALFVALVGDRFDGHDYLRTAQEKGARAAVVRRGTPPVPGLPLIEVPDTLVAYGQLGTLRRHTVPGPVVLVTGNNGKTTTKEMVAAVLRTRYRVHATRANNNNLIGVPLTILEAPADVEALVIEGGGDRPGELPALHQIVAPSITVATNATAGHLEGYGTLEAIIADTAACCAGTALAVVGAEPPALVAAARRVAPRVVSVGWAEADRIPAHVTLDALGRPALTLGAERVQLPLPGRHQALNATFAWEVGRQLGLDEAAMATALAGVTVPGGRSELRQEGRMTLLNDCYNANPHSFLAAIATARELARGGAAGRRPLVVVAGTMRELGSDAERLHAEVAAALVALEPTLLAAVGEFAPALAPYRAQLGGRLLTAPDADTMAPLLAPQLAGDEIVVLKGSRGVQLERMLPAILARAQQLP